jgi:Trk K+ transport system NAD-binding subunit
MIVSTRQQGFKGPIYAFVEKPSHRRPIILAGATAAYTPRHVLAAALAAKASDRIAPRVAGLRHLGAHLHVSELRIQPDSELAGKTLKEANIRANTGATVLGQWGRKDFIALPGADEVLEAGAMLLAVGSEEAVEKLGKLAVPISREGAFVVCGYGEVGFKVAQMLRDVGEEVTVVERRELEGVDVVGDALDPAVLNRASVAEAKAVILALDAGPTLFAASVIRDLAPEVPIIARVNRADNVARVRQAGADFSMSISQVAAQIIAQQLLGEQSISLESNVKLTQVTAAGIAGKTPHDSGVADQTGCAIVAVERGDEVIVALGHGFVIDKDDTVYICGSISAVAAYFKVFPQPRD